MNTVYFFIYNVSKPQLKVKYIIFLVPILFSHKAFPRSGMDKVLKTTVFLQDIADFGRMNEVYGQFFSEGQYPARSAVQVAALPMGARVEIEAVACK